MSVGPEGRREGVGPFQPKTIEPHLQLGAHNNETLTGAKTLSVSDPNHQRLDANGAGRDVNLPAEADSEGAWFEILNTATAANSLTVKDDGGSTIVTIAQNRKATVVCDGVSWRHMGIVTIALS